jgi:hypothetical protein
VSLLLYIFKLPRTGSGGVDLSGSFCLRNSTVNLTGNFLATPISPGRVDGLPGEINGRVMPTKAVVAGLWGNWTQSGIPEEAGRRDSERWRLT